MMTRTLKIPNALRGESEIHRMNPNPALAGSCNWTVVDGPFSLSPQVKGSSNRMDYRPSGVQSLGTGRTDWTVPDTGINSIITPKSCHTMQFVYQLELLHIDVIVRYSDHCIHTNNLLVKYFSFLSFIRVSSAYTSFIDYQ